MTEAEQKQLDHPPGSDEAVRHGCTCPRVDNGYGRGYLGGVQVEGATLYVFSADCPLHLEGEQPAGAKVLK